MEPLPIKWLLRVVSLLVIFLCGYVFLLLSPIWQPVLTVLIRVSLPFLIAGAITYLLHPIVEQMKSMGVPRPISILLIYIAFMFVFAYLLMKGTPYIIDEVKDLMENIPHFVNIYRDVVGDFYKQTSMMPDGFRVKVEGWLTNIEGVAAEGVVGTVENLGGLFDYLLMIIIIPFLVFYLLKDFNLLEKTAWYLTPRKWRSSGRELLRNINVSLGNYIRGQLLVCLVVAVIATIGLWLIGMPYAVILGIFIGVTNIIPYFGPIIGAIPVAIIAFTESFQLVLLGLMVNFGIQLVEGNILSPLIVGKSLHMHPILIMFALIVGGEVGGIIGLIIAVPILAIIKVILVHVREQLQKKHEKEAKL
ncbi:AI-2E family transporter [Anaerobacillus isosaccharinicus]|uniref:AI-2E family transporter n=1 Tax=Anaerobacillus isosaccharinicus TaxID=1532552 RepID=A0A1S2LGL8_9BACI|nr:AI-2E family transporter [Anaerobacillus isosaccharinicus]MBA5585392.1 AI-2E family transporter [Anaerobacillus isosaccharinicus]QOY36288.1 AI-2E family transporter [Anaerobacillus isosaccharinicus]